MRHVAPLRLSSPSMRSATAMPSPASCAAAYFDCRTDGLHADHASFLDGDALGVVDHLKVVARRAEREHRGLRKHAVGRPKHQQIEVDHSSAA